MKRVMLPLACLLLLNPLAHAAESKRCTYVEVGALPIRYAGEGLAPAIDGIIDGTPATMLVDTGDFETHLTMTGVVRRDLFLHMTGRYVDGVGGSSRLYSARLKEIALGPIRNARTVNVPVIAEAMITPAFDAIVGAPFLLQADLEFDLQAKKMRFFRPLNCDGIDLALWKEDTVALPFEFSRSNSPNPHFTVVVNGKELDALIDTGAHRSFMSSQAARKLGIDLKGPGVTRTGISYGIGEETAPRWRTAIKTVQIGGEKIEGGELDILEAQSELDADLLLGQDFLRSHRVLFAMSQKKVYLAYLGGDVFTRSTGIEPWMREEAEAGNPDAQYTLASIYNGGRGVARDLLMRRHWLEKAAAGGQPNANLILGRQLLTTGHADEAIPKLRAALDKLPSERLGALWLYNARMHNGEAALARSELEAQVKKQKDENWPAPIADFYLGKLDAAGLLDTAGKDRNHAKGRTCQANGYMSEWYDAQGDKARAESLMAAVRAQCAPAAAPKTP
jgi:predicted aspartyl protease